MRKARKAKKEKLDRILKELKEEDDLSGDDRKYLREDKQKKKYEV